MLRWLSFILLSVFLALPLGLSAKTIFDRLELRNLPVERNGIVSEDAIKKLEAFVDRWSRAFGVTEDQVFQFALVFGQSSHRNPTRFIEAKSGRAGVLENFERSQINRMFENLLEIGPKFRQEIEILGQILNFDEVPLEPDARTSWPGNERFRSSEPPVIQIPPGERFEVPAEMRSKDLILSMNGSSPYALGEIVSQLREAMPHLRPWILKRIALEFLAAAPDHYRRLRGILRNRQRLKNSSDRPIHLTAAELRAAHAICRSVVQRLGHKDHRSDHE